MPIGYYNTPTGHAQNTIPMIRWYVNQTAATSATATVWTWLDSGTGATTAVWTQPPSSYWSPTFAPRVIDPRRLYLARRSQQLAMEHELHDIYRREEQRQRAELGRHNEAAVARSRELLLEHLSPAQRETFERNKWFVIEGGKSRQRYRIRAVYHMVANVDVLNVLDDGKEIVAHRLCAHCRLDEVPLFDQLLAQKLMLEFDEERFLSLANRHRAAA